MGLFNYNNPFIVLLVKIANMIIVSLYWVICCLPVVTIMPACAALYHSVNKVIAGNGNGVTRDFFAAFKASLRPGIALSVLTVLVGGLVAFGIYTGTKIWSAGIFGTVYMAAGVLIGFSCLTMLIYIAPALSRFEGSVSVILRLAMYFSSLNLLRSGWYVVLLALAFWVVDFFPLLLLVVPALYMDLIRGGTEKAIQKYMKVAGLEEEQTEEEEVSLPSEPEELSARELDEMLTRETEHV